MFASDNDVILISFAKTLLLELLLRGSFGCHRKTIKLLRGLPESMAGCVGSDCVLLILSFKLKSSEICCAVIQIDYIHIP